MKLETAYYTSQLVVAVAVVLSLVALTLQIGQNTRAIEGQAILAVTEVLQRDVAPLMGTGIPAVWVKSIDSPESLTRKEIVQLDAFMTASLVARQNEFLQHRHDALNESLLGSFSVALRFTLGSRWHRNWWDQVGQYFLEPQFVEFVDNLLASPAPSSTFRDLDSYFKSLELIQTDI